MESRFVGLVQYDRQHHFAAIADSLVDNVTVFMQPSQRGAFGPVEHQFENTAALRKFLFQHFQECFAALTGNRRQWNHGNVAARALYDRRTGIGLQQIDLVQYFNTFRYVVKTEFAQNSFDIVPLLI